MFGNLWEMLIIASLGFRNFKKDGFEPGTRNNRLGVDGEVGDKERKDISVSYSKKSSQKDLCLVGLPAPSLYLSLPARRQSLTFNAATSTLSGSVA